MRVFYFVLFTAMKSKHKTMDPKEERDGERKICIEE